MLHASCHCGAVKFEIARKTSTLTACNCSICIRYGALWAYYKKKGVKVIAKPKALRHYRWGSKTIEFYYCRKCGCLTHYEAVKKKGPETRIAVNARMMDSKEVAETKVYFFDGADSWKVLRQVKRKAFL
jgi:hypothetical protein